MRRISPLLLTSIALLVTFTVMASAPDPEPGQWLALQSGAADGAGRLDSVQPLGGGVALRFSVPGLRLRTVQTKGGPRGALEIEDGAVTAGLGHPRLPVLRYLVEIPPGADVQLDLAPAAWQRIALADLGLPAKLVPVQPPIPKIEGAEKTVPYVEDAAAYATDGFLPPQPAVVADRAVIRGRHVALVEVRPVRYNPVQGAIEAWSSAELRVRFEGGAPDAARREKSRLASKTYDSLLSSVIVELPGTQPAEPAAPRGAAGGAAEGAAGMVVICHDDFATAIQPLLDWKRKTGFKVELILTSALGASPTDVDVKAAIQSRYDTWTEPSLDFILLVGDTDFTPIHTGNGGGKTQVTDNWYGCLDGTDYLPEVATARISTRTEAETTAVVDKLMLYEQATFATDGWIKLAGFIGTEDSGHISLIEGTHDWCIDNYMTPNYYLPTTWSHGGASCDRHYNTHGATTQQISDSVDEGRSWINYSGHGSTTGWAGAVSGQGYDQSDVRANTNDGMYPVVISNACVTGSLALTECYAETWVKEPNKGAIAFWGASNNSYWDEDDVLQRALYGQLFPVATQPMGDTDMAPPLGVILHQTLLDLYTHYGDVGNVAYYYDMYNLVSEPSLLVWSRVPRDLDVSYDSAIPIGESAFNVSVTYLGTPVEGVMVAVRKQDEGVFEAGYTDALGEVSFTLDPAPDGVGALEVTVTGQDWRPHEGTADVIAPDQPWLVHRGHAVDDSAGGDGDGQVNPGEDFVMPVTVENVGEQPGSGMQGTLTTSTPQWCQVLDGSASFPDLAAHTQGDSLPDHYAVRVLGSAPDGALLGFDLAWSASGGYSGTTSFKELVRAVDFTFDYLAIDDSVGGNNNGVAGPGETVDMVLTVTNVGHRDASGISGTISTASPYITLLQDTAGFPDLDAGIQGGSQPPAYSFEISAGAPDQQPVTFDLTLTEAGSGHSEVIQFDVMISSCATTPSTDVPHPIDDNATVESTLHYTKPTLINEVNVWVDITHSYQGDVEVVLESPEGTQVILHNRSGGSANDIVTWYDTETAPAESLDLLVGESAGGIWKLIVTDHAGGDTGTLNGWALEICGDPLLPIPQLAMTGQTMSDVGTCNPDNVADVGETVIYEVTVRNDGYGLATGVTASLHSAMAVAALNNPVPLPDLPVGAETVAAFEVLIGAVSCKDQIDFTVEMGCAEGTWFDTFSDRVEWDTLNTLDMEDLEHAGAEPAGWSHSADTGTDDWAPASDRNRTAGGSWSWHATSTTSMKDISLYSPPYTISGTPALQAHFEFWHQYSMTDGTDGGALEYSTDGGSTWSDAGGLMVQGGYDGSVGSGNPMGARSVWSGTQGSWRQTVLDLSSMNGSTVHFRWRLGCGFFGVAGGWWIDDVNLSTYDEPCDAHACGIPGEVEIIAVSKQGSDPVLEWWQDPLCTGFSVWRSSDPSSAGSFVDVTGEDPDATDCFFTDGSGAPVLFWIIEGHGPDGTGPWGHFGQ